MNKEKPERKGWKAAVALIVSWFPIPIPTYCFNCQHGSYPSLEGDLIFRKGEASFQADILPYSYFFYPLPLNQLSGLQFSFKIDQKRESNFYFNDKAWLCIGHREFIALGGNYSGWKVLHLFRLQLPTGWCSQWNWCWQNHLRNHARKFHWRTFPVFFNY